MAKMIYGNLLSDALKRQALASYVHRYTREHVPAWARQPRENGSAYPVQFDSDAQWLACTRFPVSADGTRLLQRECESTPAWPDNPELRGGPMCGPLPGAGSDQPCEPEPSPLELGVALVRDALSLLDVVEHIDDGNMADGRLTIIAEDGAVFRVAVEVLEPGA